MALKRKPNAFRTLLITAVVFTVYEFISLSASYYYNAVTAHEFGTERFISGAIEIICGWLPAILTHWDTKRQLKLKHTIESTGKDNSNF